MVTFEDPRQPEPPAPADLHAPVLDWYAGHARDLPWRGRSASPWGVLVSEVMLQQTPVARVLPVWQAWLQRWPDPPALASASSGDAVRAWGRLGYPRRALRLHAAATLVRERHGGQVPADEESLRTLPGVGAYTAAAVAAFAFGARTAVLDTNVRRVLARLVGGVALAPVSPTSTESQRAVAYLPQEPRSAARWNVALMELGALVCTARSPRCDACPVQEHCRWVRSGAPPTTGPPRRGQAWEGTDRQCRGQVLAVLRTSDDPVPIERLTSCGTGPAQRRRAIAGLVDDGLVQAQPDGRVGLPG